MISRRCRAEIVRLISEGHTAHAISVITRVSSHTIRRLSKERKLELQEGRRRRYVLPGIGPLHSDERGHHTLLTQKEAGPLIQRGVKLLQKVGSPGRRWRLWLSVEFEKELSRWMERISDLPPTQPREVREDYLMLLTLSDLIDKASARSGVDKDRLNKMSADELSQLMVHADYRIARLKNRN